MEKYKDIVSDWYLKLQTPFINFIRGQFPAISYDDAMDIYQETFIAISNNLQKGAIKEDTKWKSYIFEIGRRQAMKMIGKDKTTTDVDFSDTASITDLFDKKIEDNFPLYKDETAMDILDEQVKYIPEPCYTILTLFYHERMKMTDIASAVNFKNAQTAKAKKNQCLDKLKTRVKQAFRLAGIDI
jgi:RNA polymerase sigma factor (sigma-70 family)